MKSSERAAETRRARVVFMGAVHEAVPLLRMLVDDDRINVVAVVTAPPSLARTLSGFVDLAGTAKPAGIPVLRPPNANDPAFVAELRERRPDLIVAAGWTRLLGEALLALPPLGCIGFHASLLPRNRGRAPVNWAILRGERVTGNTMMYLAPGADTGDIIDQREVPIDDHDTCGTVYDKVAAAGVELLRTHLPGILRGTAPRSPQPRVDADPLPKRTPEMGIIDWNQRARDVHDWIRGLAQPYPGAFGTVDGRRVTVWASEAPRDMPVAAEPGTFLGTDGEGLRVAVRGGSLSLTRVQEHRDEMDGATWLRHRAGRVDHFDPVPPAVAAWARGVAARASDDTLAERTAP